MLASPISAALLLALATAVAGVDNFVNVPTSGLEPGWQFQAYEFDRRNNFAEISGTRKTGVVASPEFFVGSNAAPAVYGLGATRDFIMIKWSGFLRITLTGTYNFELGSDDGSMLYIDGLLVSDWHVHSLGQACLWLDMGCVYVLRDGDGVEEGASAAIVVSH